MTFFGKNCFPLFYMQFKKLKLPKADFWAARQTSSPATKRLEVGQTTTNIFLNDLQNSANSEGGTRNSQEFPSACTPTPPTNTHTYTHTHTQI